MQRSSILITSLALTACLRLPEGEDLTDSGGSGTGASDAEGTDPGATDAADGTTEADDPPAGADIDWSLELGSGLSVFTMLRSPAGVVVVLQGDPYPETIHAEVVEVSSSMESLWSKTLAHAWVSDIEALGDGEYVLGGSAQADPMGPTLPTAWRLSCCAEVVGQTYPQETDEPAWVSVAAPHGDEILLVIDHGQSSATFLHAPAALYPTTALGSVDFAVHVGARTQSGSVLLAGSRDGNDRLLYEVEPDGAGAEQGLGQPTALVGSGDDLTLMTFAAEQVGIRPYAGGAEVPVTIPGFDDEEYTPAARRERIVLAYRQVEPAGGTTTHVAEFDDDGALVRTLALPRLQHDYAAPTAVEVGEDDAVYVAVGESEPAGGRVVYLHRIAPL